MDWTGNPDKPYGKEVIIDLKDCNPAKFTRTLIEDYFIELCDRIDMERRDLFWWDYAGYPEAYAAAPDHLKGTSAVQFIRTSNITIHTLDVLKTCHLNIFSCKDFDPQVAIDFSVEFFEGVLTREPAIVDRG